MLVKRSKDLKYKAPQSETQGDYPYAHSAEVFSTKQLFLYSEKVKPGTKASAPHYHRLIDEIVYITKGKLVAVEGDQRCELNVGDSICFIANSQKQHYLENCSKTEAEFLIFRKNTDVTDAVFNNN